MCESYLDKERTLTMMEDIGDIDRAVDDQPRHDHTTLFPKKSWWILWAQLVVSSLMAAFVMQKLAFTQRYM